MKNKNGKPKMETKVYCSRRKKKAKRIYWKKAKVYFWYRQRLESNYTSFQKKKKKQKQEPSGLKSLKI